MNPTAPTVPPALTVPEPAHPCRCGVSAGRLADAATGALVVVLVIAIIYCAACALRAGRREGFVSPRAQNVYRNSADLFGQTRGDATYSDFKAREAQADPVLYTDVRNLWRSGKLTPEAVQAVL